jgi:hypothetical protein
MIAMGNINAPAIKKPHDPTFKHTITCVNHAARKTMNKPKYAKSNGMIDLKKK